MTAVATTPVIRTDAWESFTPGAWTQHIDVRDFILRNFTPYTGDASFLAGPTARTLTMSEGSMTPRWEVSPALALAITTRWSADSSGMKLPA